MSKADFRKAVGSLYKDRVVIPSDHEIRLVPHEEREFKTAVISSERIEARPKDSKDGQYKVFVGNLPVSINEKILSNTVDKLLGKGKVMSIRLPLNPNKQSRGFAFLSFDSEELQMEALSRLKGFQLMGRLLRTDIADSPKQPAEVNIRPSQETAAKRQLSTEEEDALSIEDLINSAPDDDSDSHAHSIPQDSQPRKVAATIYVGNLSYDVDERTLTQAVERITSRGAVLECRIATDRENGRKRGFGYVDLWNKDDAKKILQKMNGTLVMGRPVRVDDATRSRDS